MKWIILILIFAGGIYYIVNEKKQEEIRKIQAEEIKKNEMRALESPLPESVKKEYSLSLSKDTVSTLRGLTEDTNEKVRISAVELLWQMQDPESPKLIKKMLENETETSVKIKIIELISRDKTRLSLKLLAEALKNYDKDTRVKAAEVLGEYATEDAIKTLNGALNDYDEEVKLKALESVNKIKKQIEKRRKNKRT
ncbi:MAG: HEAT repeat domain-containing protein [Elusimicrobiota bacterium]